MHQELAVTDDVAEFTCPRCGASAFEVTDMEQQVSPDIDATSDKASFLSMKCLHCLHVFHHEIHEYPSLKAFQEPPLMMN